MCVSRVGSLQIILDFTHSRTSQVKLYLFSAKSQQTLSSDTLHVE